MVAFGIQWTLMSEAPWQSIRFQLILKSGWKYYWRSLQFNYPWDMPEMGMSMKRAEQLASGSPH